MAEAVGRAPADQEVLPWAGGASVRVLLDAAACDGAMTMLEIAAGSGYVAATHVHDREDETFVLLAGGAVVTAGQREHVLVPGSSVWLPRRVPHGYRVTAAGTRLLHVSVPGGLDRFFREAARLLQAPDDDRPAADALARAAGRFGISYLSSS